MFGKANLSSNLAPIGRRIARLFQGLSVLLVIFCAFAITACKPAMTERAKRFEETPKEDFPDVYYKKFDGNWYRFLLKSSQNRNVQLYPIMDIDYVKGQKMPMLIEYPEDKKFLGLNSRHMMAQQKHIMKKYGVTGYGARSKSANTGFFTSSQWPCKEGPSKEGPTSWRSIGEHFEARAPKNASDDYWRKGIGVRRNGQLGKWPKVFRSKRPIYFDQYVYFKNGYFYSIDRCGAPTSDYPYLRFTSSVEYEGDEFKKILHDKNRNIKIWSAQHLRLLDQKLYFKSRVLEAVVKDIYIGPELPDDVKRQAEKWMGK